MPPLSDKHTNGPGKGKKLKRISFPINSPFEAKSKENDSAKDEMTKESKKGLTGLTGNIKKTYIII